jgi:hypothetical protein
MKSWEEKEMGFYHTPAAWDSFTHTSSSMMTCPPGITMITEGESIALRDFERDLFLNEEARTAG